MPTYTTICLDYFNEIAPCISTCSSGQHDIKCIRGYTIASNTLKCKAVDVKTAVEIWTGNVSCTPKLCGVPPSVAETLHTSAERYYLDFVAHNCESGYSLNGLRHSKKEFLLVCKSDGTYVPHLTCQPIDCTLEDAPTAKMIEFSGGSLPSSSPMVLDPNEWLKYQCGECHTLSEISDSSDLFTMTCLDGRSHKDTLQIRSVRSSACDLACNATG